MTRKKLLRKMSMAPVLGLLAGIFILSAGCVPPAPEGQLFSFAVIADPHVSSGNPATTEKMAACVDWINTHHADEDKGIAMVFVLGDMGGGRGALVKAILDDLEIPYVPVIGDNDVHWTGGGQREGCLFYRGKGV